MLLQYFVLISCTTCSLISIICFRYEKLKIHIVHYVLIVALFYITVYYCFMFHYIANTVFMTDMPPPYPGINAAYQGYASSAPPQGAWGSSTQQSGWTPPQQNGAPGWANPNYNAQPMSQAGAYPNYGQPPQYNNYSPNPPPYTPYPQGGNYAQSSYYSQQNPYDSYPRNY